MIEGISAITLATHDMRRAVRFYRMLGFAMLYGGEDEGFTSAMVRPHRPLLWCRSSVRSSST
jgi:catechol 2,3-dioxygenase-like lactoylglutathione lyase family enzyme